MTLSQNKMSNNFSRNFLQFIFENQIAEAETYQIALNSFILFILCLMVVCVVLSICYSVWWVVKEEKLKSISSQKKAATMSVLIPPVVPKTFAVFLERKVDSKEETKL